MRQTKHTPERLEDRRLFTATVVGSPTVYPTIQSAVAAAPVGGTVRVGPGQYDELVTIAKTLTVQGAFAGVDARAFGRTDSRGHRTPTAVTLLPESPDIPGYRPQDHKHDPAGQMWLGLRWKPNGLPPGLYTLAVSMPVSAKDGDGQAVSLPAAAASVTVYRPPAPDHLPSLTPGQRFLCLPDWTDALPYLDAHGQPVRRALLALKLWMLKRIDRTGREPVLYFAVEGLPGLVHVENGGSVSALPGLSPLVEDAALRSLRRKYASHRVWGYGGLSGTCLAGEAGEGSGVTLDNKSLCRLVHLVRISGTPTQLSIGTKPGVIGGATQSEFTTPAPLIALLAPPAHTQVAGFIFVWIHGRRHVRERPDGEPIFQLSECRLLYAQFADAWDFERTYSLISPQQAGRRWPKALRSAVLAGRISSGMTPEMAAWTLGYPNAYGTAAQIQALPEWEYDNLPPFHYYVDFQKGKVTGYGPDGTLP